MGNGIRASDPVDQIKDVVRSSVKAPEFDKKQLKKGRRTHRCECKNKDENNIPIKSSFRQLMMSKSYISDTQEPVALRTTEIDWDDG